MACALTQGYTLDCRDNVGGIKEKYVTEHANITAITAASGIITAITMASGTMFRKYELEKETGSFTENIQTNDANGTIFYEQDSVMPIRKLQASLRNEIKLLAQNRLVIIEKDRNGKYWLLGENNGMELQPSTAATGTAMGDFNGYTLNFKGKEENPAQEVSSGIISGLLTPA